MTRPRQHVEQPGANLYGVMGLLASVAAPDLAIHRSRHASHTLAAIELGLRPIHPPERPPTALATVFVMGSFWAHPLASRLD